MIRGLMSLKSLSLVFVGAGAGGVTRYLLALWLNPLLVEVPMGTLAANVVGCGAAGALIGFLAEYTALDMTLRPLLMAGFLGGLTTFSSFAVEVVQTLEAQRPLLATALVCMHVGASLAAAIAGLMAARALLA
jgi:CrcB protein